jgi:phosphopantetheinyl transferase
MLTYRSNKLRKLEQDYFETQDPKERQRIHQELEKEDREEYLANLLGLTIAGLFLAIVVAVWSLLNDKGL